MIKQLGLGAMSGIVEDNDDEAQEPSQTKEAKKDSKETKAKEAETKEAKVKEAAAKVKETKTKEAEAKTKGKEGAKAADPKAKEVVTKPLSKKELLAKKEEAALTDDVSSFLKRTKEGAAEPEEVPFKPTASTRPPPAPTVLPVIVPQKHGQLLLPTDAQWHTVSLSAPAPAGPMRTNDAMQLFERAKEIMAEQQRIFEGRRTMNSSDRSWIDTVLSSGTIADRVAALVLLVQEAPVYRVNMLETLVGMMRKKIKREALLAANAIKDLLLTNLLPDRKLKTFASQPLSARVSDAHLFLWCFEDALKHLYVEFLSLLEEIQHDTLPHPKSRAVAINYELLEAKPEQEAVLLTLLVNKLGDTDGKIASKVVYLLNQLLVKHPNMKPIVIREVEALMFKPKAGERAQYYGTTFLNQIILTKKDAGPAARLVDVYFTIYRTVVSKPDADARMLSALLTGINRAVPYAELPDKTYEDHVTSLFKLVHTGSFNTTIQALVLLRTIADRVPGLRGRFYRTLYDVTLDIRLSTASKQTMFINVFFAAVKNDDSIPRIKALLKRLCQVSAQQSPGFACAVLFVMSEIFKHKPGLALMLTQPEENDDDGEEHFRDAPDEDDEEAPAPAAAAAAKASETSSSGYDYRKRDPQYSGADKTCMWELIPLLNHYHPSVSKLANQLLKSERIPRSADFFEEFSLMHFLDRFVFKNPKKSERRGDSAMQPLRRARSIWNEKQFATAKEANVPEDQLFFHKFFAQKAKLEAANNVAKKRKSKSDDDDDLDSAGSEEEEDIVDAAVGSDGDEDEDEDEENEFGDDFDDDEEEEFQQMMEKQMEMDGIEPEELDGELDDDEEDGEDDDEDMDMDRCASFFFAFLARCSSLTLTLQLCAPNGRGRLGRLGRRRRSGRRRRPVGRRKRRWPRRRGFHGCVPHERRR